MSQSFHSFPAPFMSSRVKLRYITSLWEDNHSVVATTRFPLRKRKMRRWLCHLVYVKRVRVSGSWFIRVAVEHSVMLNLAYRGFSKSRCMQVVDATLVFNGPFLSVLLCICHFLSFFVWIFCFFLPKAATLQNLQIGVRDVCSCISHP